MRWHWLSALVLCAMPCVVWPHSLLRGSEPPANAVIDQPPLQIRLHFSEAVEKGFARIEVKADDQLLNLSASGFQWDASGKKAGDCLARPLARTPVRRGVVYVGQGWASKPRAFAFQSQITLTWMPRSF